MATDADADADDDDDDDGNVEMDSHGGLEVTIRQTE